MCPQSESLILSLLTERFLVVLVSSAYPPSCPTLRPHIYLNSPMSAASQCMIRRLFILLYQNFSSINTTDNLAEVRIPSSSNIKLVSNLDLVVMACDSSASLSSSEDAFSWSNPRGVCHIINLSKYRVLIPNSSNPTVVKIPFLLFLRVVLSSFYVVE